MRFLADESCDFSVVRSLRSNGFDVEAIIEIQPGMPDSDVAARAIRANRILLTEDKDFGQMVFASMSRATGVVLMRYPASARRLQADDIVLLVEKYGQRLASSFTVIQPGRIRFAPRLV